jgi:hypothetical protein
VQQLQTKLSEAAARVQALSAENDSKSTNIEVPHQYSTVQLDNACDCSINSMNDSNLEACMTTLLAQPLVT